MRKHVSSFVVCVCCYICIMLAVLYLLFAKKMGFYNVVSLTVESPLSAVFYLMHRKTAPSVTFRNLMYAMGESGVREPVQA